MKSWILFVLIAFLFIPYAYAIESNIQQTYKPLQTLIVELKGNFISKIKYDDVFFYSGRTYIPMQYDLERIGTNYYIYAILPNKQRNYTLLIKNVNYFENGEEKTSDLSYNFSVSGNVSSFNIRPGFIVTEEDFDLTATVNDYVNVKISFLNQKYNISLSPGADQRIHFSLGNATSQITKLILEAADVKYEVPVKIIRALNKTAQSCLIDDIRFSLKEINTTLQYNTTTYKTLKIINTGEENFTNFSVVPSSNIKDMVKIENVTQVLKPNEWETINITISAYDTGNFSGFLKIGRENCYAKIPLNINVLENLSDINASEVIGNESNLRKCGEIKKIIGEGFGEICEEGSECNIGTIETADTQQCCLGECITRNKNKKTGTQKNNKPLIFLLLIILLIIAFIIYKRVSSVKKSAKDILKERAKKYEEKFKEKK